MNYNTSFLSALIFEAQNFKKYSKRVPLEWLKHDKVYYEIYKELIKQDSKNLPLETIEFKKQYLNEQYLKMKLITFRNYVTIFPYFEFEV